MPKADTYSPSEVLGAINFDNISELEFYSYCFNESLRMQPPVYISSTVSMMESICESSRVFSRARIQKKSYEARPPMISEQE